MKAQLASPGFTPVFAALVSVVNTKLPENGELILKRVIVAFRRAYKRRDKVVATALAKFIAHMVNQQVSSCLNQLLLGNIGTTRARFGCHPSLLIEEIDFRSKGDGR